MQKKRTPFEVNDMETVGNTSSVGMSRTGSWSEQMDLAIARGLHASHPSHPSRLHRSKGRTSTQEAPPKLHTTTLDEEQADDHARVPLKHSSPYPTIIPIEDSARFPAKGFWGRLAQRCVPLITETCCVLCDLPVLLLLGCLTRAASKVPARRAFVLKSRLQDYSYPIKEDTISGGMNHVLSIVPFVVIVSAYHLFWRPRPGWREWYRTIVCLVCAIVLSTLITDLLKAAVGRPRPHFNVQCWTDGVIRFSSENEFGGYPECSEDHGRISCKSFPSDHSSTSASGMGLLSFWLAGKMRVFSGPSKIWQLLVSIVPAMGAIAVGLTRITDHKHHVEDVCTGWAIGFGVAFFAYLQVWPFWTHPMCHEPHPEGQSLPSPAQGFQDHAASYPHAQQQQPSTSPLSQEPSFKFSPVQSP